MSVINLFDCVCGNPPDSLIITSLDGKIVDISLKNLSDEVLDEHFSLCETEKAKDEFSLFSASAVEADLNRLEEKKLLHLVSFEQIMGMKSSSLRPKQIGAIFSKNSEDQEAFIAHLPIKKIRDLVLILMGQEKPEEIGKHQKPGKKRYSHRESLTAALKGLVIIACYTEIS